MLLALIMAGLLCLFCAVFSFIGGSICGIWGISTWRAIQSYHPFISYNFL